MSQRKKPRLLGRKLTPKTPFRRKFEDEYNQMNRIEINSMKVGTKDISKTGNKLLDNLPEVDAERELINKFGNKAIPSWMGRIKEKLGFGYETKKESEEMAMGGFLDGVVGLFEGDELGAGSLGLSTLGHVGSGIHDIKRQGSMARQSMSPTRVDSNYMMAQGGDLVRFGGKDHEEGGTPIDEQMNFNPLQPVAEVEKAETGVDIRGRGKYIFSKRLGARGSSFADKSKTIDDKYSKKQHNSSRDSVKGKNLEYKILAMENDEAKKRANYGKEMLTRMMGGALKKYGGGGPFDIPGRHFNDDFKVGAGQTIGLRGTPVPASIQSGAERFTTSIPRTLDLENDNIPDMDFSVDSEPRKEVDYDKVAMGLKGAALVKQGFDAMRGPDDVPMRINPYAGDVERLMENRNVDMTSIQNNLNLQKNAALSDARRNSGTLSMANAAAQQIFSRMNRSMSENAFQEQGQNNQYRAQEAQTKFQLGESEKNERIRVDNAQAQNEATSREFGRDFFSGLADVGTEFNRKKMADLTRENRAQMAAMTNAEFTVLLQSKYPDFTVTPDLVQIIQEKLKAGEDVDVDDYIKYRAAKNK